MRASWLRCGFLLTFSAWGPGGPGAPALPGNPGGPWIDKEAGRNKNGAPSPFFLCLSGLAPRIYRGHLHCPATYTVLPSHLLTSLPRGDWPDLLFSMGPHYRELLGLYSPVDLESLAGLEIPRGRSEEVTPPPGHSGGKRNRWSSLQALSSSTQDGQQGRLWLGGGRVGRRIGTSGQLLQPRPQPLQPSPQVSLTWSPFSPELPWGPRSPRGPCCQRGECN